ncbi:hypothetical protein [Breoghania sp. L-A4]|nr:hypothetical protein [Breoghania sp. L-A4]
MPNAPTIAITAAVGMTLLATLGLWARYGEVIFTDIALAALGGCLF